MYMHVYIYTCIDVYICLYVHIHLFKIFGHDITSLFMSGPLGLRLGSQAQALATSGLWGRGDLEEVLDAGLKEMPYEKWLMEVLEIWKFTNMMKYGKIEIGDGNIVDNGNNMEIADGS